MRSGDLTVPERLAVDRAIRAAETRTRFEFSVYVGATESTPQDYSERMHAVLAAPERSVMVMIDPGKRAAYITTGREVRAQLADSAVQRIVDRLAASIGAGDVADAIAMCVAALAAECSPARVDAGR